jgi:BA14K-like protein
MRKFAAAALAATVIGTTIVPAGASPRPATPDLNRVYPGESYTQYRRYYGGRYYHHGYYHGSGGAVAAGVAGLAAGALIAGALANQAQAAPPPPPATVDPQLAAYCARRFRSFDPYTGTYLASSGERIVCTY